MSATEVLTELCRRLDEHRWDDLSDLLAPEFTCHYVHTCEDFDRETWVRFNAEYPGFDRMFVEEILGEGGRAVARCRATSEEEGVGLEFVVASFAEVSEGRVVRLTEVWTDVAQAAPPGTRPVC